MNAFKRNAVILTVLLFVCVAVYLNWAYNKNEDVITDVSAGTNSQNAAGDDSGDVNKAPETDGDASADTAGTAGESGLFYTADTDAETATDTVSEYFASVRLTREQARDSACETLSAVSTAEGASQETIDAALAEIASVAEATVLEAELESLIKAKGFAECVVFISDEGINVTVQSPADGMSSAAVARITDVVLEKTEFTADDLEIIEVK